MSSEEVSRRDFLKLLGTTPFLLSKWPVHLPQWTPPFQESVGVLPNILILVFDALSARNMSLYGYPRQTTPNMERFARQATVFYRHYAGGSFTSPGTASLLTGSYPWSHRVYQFYGSIQEGHSLTNLFSLLYRKYSTFSYTHNPAVFVLLHQFRKYIHELPPISELCLAYDSSTDQWFLQDYPVALEGENLSYRNLTFPSGSLFLSFIDDLKRLMLHISLNRAYRDRFPRGVSRFSIGAPPSFMYFTLEDAIDWLQQQVNEIPSPFLGYVHLFPPHSPYVARREFIDCFDDHWTPPRKPSHFFSQGYSNESLESERRLYDEAIAYVDAEFGRLFDFMQRSGMLKNTYFILTTDHGEMFERGIQGHDTPTLYEPLIHIPLLVASPGQVEPQEIHTPTSCVDLIPTLLHVAGLPASPECEGQVLPGIGETSEDPLRSVYVMDAKENPSRAPLRKATVALVKGRHKLIHYFGYPGYTEAYELYDLVSDPEELENRYEVSDPLSIALKEELSAKIAQVNSS